MAGLYERLRDTTANTLLTKYGQAMTLSWKGSETFNEQTGFVTGGSTQTESVYGVVYPNQRKFRAGEGVVKKTVKIYLNASGLTHTPVEGDLLTVEATTYAIVECDPVDPGGVDVLYD